MANSPSRPNLIKRLWMDQWDPRRTAWLLANAAGYATLNLAFVPVYLSGQAPGLIYTVTPFEMGALMLIGLTARSLRRFSTVVLAVGAILCGLSFVSYVAVLRSRSGSQGMAVALLILGLVLMGTSEWLWRKEQSSLLGACRHDTDRDRPG